MTAVVTLLLAAGCTDGGPQPQEMYAKAVQLVKLTAAVESTVRYKNPPDDLSEQALLKRSTEHDPSMLAEFAAFSLRVRREGRHAVVLMCSADGKRALLEDAGCTAELDRHRWESKPAPACEFSLSSPTLCSKP